MWMSSVKYPEMILEVNNNTTMMSGDSESDIDGESFDESTDDDVDSDEYYDNNEVNDDNEVLRSPSRDLPRITTSTPTHNTNNN